MCIENTYHVSGVFRDRRADNILLMNSLYKNMEILHIDKSSIIIYKVVMLDSHCCHFDIRSTDIYHREKVHNIIDRKCIHIL